MEPELFPIWSPWFVALKAVEAIIKAPTDARDCAGGKLQVSQLNERLPINTRGMSCDVTVCKVRSPGGH
jgi:hypothetical protein